MKARDATRAWVERHLPTPLEVHFRPSGAKYAAADRVDYFVEDSIDEVVRAAAGSPVLLDRPWNRRGAPPHVPRVTSLLEAAAVIEADLRASRPR